MAIPRRSIAHGVLWRAFPWDRTAPDGAPFSGFRQNYGRFDQHGSPSGLYLAESPAHALTEVLRGLIPDPGKDLSHTGSTGKIKTVDPVDPV